MRIALGIIIFLCVVLGFYVLKDIRNQTHITALETQNNALRGNNKFMEGEIEKRNQNALEVSRRNQELEALAKLSSEPCWNKRISASDPILVRLKMN